MHLCHSRSLLALILFLGAPALFAQTEDNPPSAPAPDLFTEYESVLSVEHLSPHILAVLNDPHVARVAEMFLDASVLTQARVQTEFFAGNGPGRVEIGLDDKAQELLCSLAQVGFALMTIQPTAVSPGSPEATEEPPPFLSVFDDLVSEGRLSIALSKLPEREIASMRESMAQWRLLAAPAITATETQLTLDVGKAIQLFPVPLLAASQLSNFGLPSEQVEKTKKWLEGLQGEARLITGDSWARLDVVLGKSDSTTSFPSREALTKELSLPTPEVLFRVNLATFKEAWTKVNADISALSAQGPPREDFFLGYELLSDALSELPDLTQGAIDVGAKSRFVTLVPKKEQRSQDLRISDLARCIPPDAKSFGLDGQNSLIESPFVAGFLEGFSEGFSESFPNPEQAQESVDRATSKLSEAFATGWGWIAEPPKPTQVTARFGSRSVEWKAAPVPSMALLFRTLDPAADLGRIFSAMDQFAKDFELGGDSASQFLHEEDVGLGIRTWVLDPTALARRIGGEASLSYADADAGSRNMIHTFRIDSVQVISSDVALSRRILEASKRSLPPVEGGPVPVSHIQGLMEWVSQMGNDLTTWLETEDSKIEGDSQPDPMRRYSVYVLAQEMRTVLESFSRTQFTRTRVIEGSFERMTSEITIGPPPQRAFAQLKPAEQRRIATDRCLEELLGHQQEDGRFVDPDPEGLSDLALTALICNSMDMMGFDRRIMEGHKQALTWLAEQQVTEGPYRGFIGDPEDPDAWEHQGMVIRAFFVGFFPVQPDAVVYEHIVQLLMSPGIQRELSLDQAAWWSEVSFRTGDFRRILELDPGMVRELGTALRNLRERCEQRAREASASSSPSPLVIYLGRYDGDDEDYVRRAKASLPRFAPAAIAEASSKISPWELKAIAEIGRGSKKLSIAWIEALASRSLSSPDETWPKFPPPYHTEVSSTAARLAIFRTLRDDRYFEAMKRQREQFPGMFPDLDE